MFEKSSLFYHTYWNFTIIMQSRKQQVGDKILKLQGVSDTLLNLWGWQKVGNYWWDWIKGDFKRLNARNVN